MRKSSTVSIKHRYWPDGAKWDSLIKPVSSLHERVSHSPTEKDEQFKSA